MSAELCGVPEEIHGIVAPHSLRYQGLAGRKVQEGTQLKTHHQSVFHGFLHLHGQDSDSQDLAWARVSPKGPKGSCKVGSLK